MKIVPYDLLKNVLFNFDPELVHDFSIKLAGRYSAIASLMSSVTIDKLKYGINVGSCNWHFPVGLAAGMDKDCQAVEFFSRVGFGAIEVGTVTPLPQLGNDKPRLFRYKDENSIRNKMGFNNRGSEELLKNLLAVKKIVDVPVGVNFGKNKLTSQKDAIKDYLKLFDLFQNDADYVVMNFSSPNTPGLRDLQQIDRMRENFQEIRKQHSVSTFRRDIYVKISPDLALADVSEIVKLVKEFSFTGLIATNTTIMPERGEGGISGELLKKKSETVRFHILDELRECPELQLIGVGGVSTFDDVWRFWKRGGKAVQVLTSLIFNGPSLLSQIQNEIDVVLKLNLVATVGELLQNIAQAKKHE